MANCPCTPAEEAKEIHSHEMGNERIGDINSFIIRTETFKGKALCLQVKIMMELHVQK
jgi:hypothetical protein